MLDRLRSQTPRWHGNGFTQLDLNSRQRLHVWHPSWAPNPGHVSTIHDHVFDMTSEVLLGKVGTEMFRVRPVDDGGNCKIYSLDSWGAPAGTVRAIVCEGYAYRYSTGSFLMTAGSQYSVPRYQFHESSHEGLTATLMTKSNGVVPGAKPRVLCPWGQDPTDARAAGHGPGLNAMWDIIEQALTPMWGSSLRRIEECLP